MFRRFFTHHWPVLTLTAVGLILSLLNHQPNTFLTGWDNLHPEFNFSLDLSRSLTAAWQEYRGLGLLGGMAHAADLPHQLLLALFSLIQIPINLHRYLFTFLCLILGPIGTYYLAQITIFSKLGPFTKRFVSFFAGLFYLFNLSTVQVFYVPFETFTTFFAALPWLLFVIINYINSPNKKNFAALIAIFLLSTPAFYVQTIFLVFAITLIPFLTHFLLQKKLLPTLIVVFSLFITNAYWLLPVAHFTLTSSQTTIQASQNQIASKEMILRNKEFGNPKEAILFKGFSFDYVDLGDNNAFQQLLTPWIHHLGNKAILVFLYAFSFLALAGTIYSFRKKHPFSLPIVFCLILSLVFLINLNPPTRPLYLLIQEIPVLKEAFRAPFTKWSIPASLFFSLFLSSFVLLLLNLSKSLHRFSYLLTSFLVILPLFAVYLPTFQGHLIYKNLRINIPSEYFQLFEYLQSQDHNTRLANFPQHTPWGWEYYNWGYRGSGFLWHGIPQPILDRAFDVWSLPSQQYFEEIKTAIYAKDLARFENVLEKYSVTWVLLDKNIILPANEDQSGLYLQELETLLQTNNFQKEKNFGAISLYRFNTKAKPIAFLDTQPKSFIPPTQSITAPIQIIDTVSGLKERSSIKEESKNCDNFNATSFKKTITGDAITYTATNANTCDHFLYPELTHQVPYLMKITHKNVSGSPLLICVESYTSKNCTVFQYLPETNNQWTTTTINLPALNPNEYGYALHTFNYSIGQTPTKNQISSIILESNQNLSPINTSLLNYPAKILKAQKQNYHFYTLTTKADVNADLLILNQAYDQNWKLYKDQFPFLPAPLKYITHFFQAPLNQHFKAYDLANGWTVPQGQQSYLIIYTPQNLQHLGFALLLLLPILYLLHKKTRP